jgi:hypothetical protein
MTMDVEALRSFLAWCTLINWILLLVWWGMFALAGDWIYNVHRKWFDLSRQTFDTTHYAGMGLYKCLIMMFNLAPYLVLRLFF